MEFKVRFKTEDGHMWQYPTSFKTLLEVSRWLADVDGIVSEGHGLIIEVHIEEAK